jgi:DNA-binding CsgD family transcriptional regulator
MRAILVGPVHERERIRQEIDLTSIEVVGEFRTITEARASGIDADVFVMSTGGGPGDDDRRSAFPAGDDEDLVEALTAREIQVLELLAEGLPNKAIAVQLGISDQTVKFHVSSISSKLGAANRTDVVRRAVRRGIIAL